MEILVLTALARAPMHGYDLKLELEYKHVEWWAKCEHGHLYSALERLARGKFIKHLAHAATRSTQRVYAITAAGRQRLHKALRTLGAQPDTTYFDLDMFLASCHVLDRKEALAILDRRRETVRGLVGKAKQLESAMRPHVPAVGRLIMEHRVAYLERELAFLGRCRAVLAVEKTWGPFVAGPLREFVQQRRIPLER